MEFKNAKDLFFSKLERAQMLLQITTLYHWDLETEAPHKGVDLSAKIISNMDGEIFEIKTSKEFLKALKILEENSEKLNKMEKRAVKLTRKEIDSIEKIPKEEYKEYSELVTKSQIAWEDAKKNSSFKDFAPYLEKVISFKKKFINYRGWKGNPYDALLDDFEEGMTCEKLDMFFSNLKEEIVPLLKEIQSSKVKTDNSFLKRNYPKSSQKEFSQFILEHIGFDFSRGVMKESVHPFTTHFNNKDVRITTSYQENWLPASIFASIHEGGHAIYEQGVSDEFTNSILGTGTSMGVHESQSRLYENILGRSLEFWNPIYNKLTKKFPDSLKDISLEKFYEGINHVEPSLIRIEADELTYNLHILIRYEIEKMMFQGKIDVMELPKIWNQKYEKYLGITPPDDAHGVLQDVHWSAGLMGYFPTYSIGNVYSAQILHSLKKELPIDELLTEGKLTPIKEFLNQKIHQYGSLLPATEVMKKAVGDDLNAKHFIKYLKEKYSKLYNLN